MNISSLLNVTPRLNSPVEKGFDTLDKLLQLGGLDARVARVDKSGILLATRLGEIIGKNSLDLKKGDLVHIRLVESDKSPVLKVRKTTAEPVVLHAAQHKALYQALKPNQTTSALVIQQRPGNIRIQIGNAEYTISQPINLKKGQILNLEPRPQNNTIEIKPVNSAQVLKSVLSHLLPRQSNPESRNALSRLLRILQPQPDQPAGNSQVLKPGAIAAKSEASQLLPVDHKTTALREQINVTNPGSKPVDKLLVDLAGRLSALLGSLPSISSINSRVIKQWIAYEGLIKIPNANQSSVAQNPLAVLHQLPDNEAALKQLVQLLFRNRSGPDEVSNKPGNEPETRANEGSSSLIRDILKLVEQSLNQQLLQKVNARHQQELQLPIALNLTIPVADKQSINDLRLKIGQKDSAANAEKQCWDIHLSFEFGNLGLISSHINLDGDLLSTSFWSTQPDTKQKIDQALPDFIQQLGNTGFIVGQFYSFAGLPAQDGDSDMPPYSDALLDIKV